MQPGWLFPEMYEFTESDWRAKQVAFWFDRLARHLFNLNLPSFEEWDRRRSLDHFDLNHDGIGCCIEVKGSSNMDQLKLFEDQLDAQMREIEIGFPFDKAFVLIFVYRNREKRHENGNQRKRLLSRNAESPEQVAKFLATQINTVLVVDLQLLHTWRQKHGVVKYTRDRIRPRNLVKISKRNLREFAEDARESLASLGMESDIPRWLPPGTKRIRSRRILTKIDDTAVSFGVIPLVPIVMRRKLFKHLNGQVVKS